MKTPTLFKEELELDQIRETQQQLIQRQREFDENRKRIEIERKERENMMPPFQEVQERIQRKIHEQSATRGEIQNELRIQKRSFFMMLLLATATATLVWWGMKLMQGG